MNKRFIYTSYGAIMDTSKTPEEGQMIFDADLDGIGEMCNLLNKQNEEIERWKTHKEWDCKTIQEQSDKIEEFKIKLAEKDQELNDICQSYDFQINDFSREVHRLKEREKVLEQKLAESESESNARYSAWQEEIGECDRLRVALAEKEKEIEELNHKLNVEQPCLLMNYKDMVDMLKKSQNQTAIAELEKLKEELDKNCKIQTFIDNYGDSAVDRSDLEWFIDQQIKSLKGEK